MSNKNVGTENQKKVLVWVGQGLGGPYLAVNKTRIAGPKPYGNLTNEFEVSVDSILNALGVSLPKARPRVGKERSKKNG
jgi:hypothetical protein